MRPGASYSFWFQAKRGAMKLIAIATIWAPIAEQYSPNTLLNELRTVGCQDESFNSFQFKISRNPKLTPYDETLYSIDKDAKSYTSVLQQPEKDKHPLRTRRMHSSKRAIQHRKHFERLRQNIPSRICLGLKFVLQKQHRKSIAAKRLPGRCSADPGFSCVSRYFSQISHTVWHRRIAPKLLSAQASFRTDLYRWRTDSSRSWPVEKSNLA